MTTALQHALSRGRAVAAELSLGSGSFRVGVKQVGLGLSSFSMRLTGAGMGAEAFAVVFCEFSPVSKKLGAVPSPLPHGEKPCR